MVQQQGTTRRRAAQVVGLLQQANPAGLMVILATENGIERLLTQQGGQGRISLQWCSLEGHPLVAQPWVRAEIIMASSSIRRICILDAPFAGSGAGCPSQWFTGLAPLSSGRRPGSIPAGSAGRSYCRPGPLAEKGSRPAG